MSPFSIETALALLFVGSEKYSADVLRKALLFGNASPGAIAAQFRSLLQPMTQPDSIVQIANGIFISKNYHVNPEYRALADDQFGSRVANIDFSQSEKAAATINSFVANKTDNKITNLVSPTSFKASATGLVLVNAIYFKGNWQFPFNERTWKAKFNYGACTKTDFKKVDMMHLKVTLCVFFLVSV